MSLIQCPDCRGKVSTSANSCPVCGCPSGKFKSEGGKVSFLLAVGIFFLPILFAWFTLRKGHSNLSRVISFSWLAFPLILSILSKNDVPTNKATHSQEIAEVKRVNEVVDSKEVIQPEQSELPKIASNVRSRIEQLLKNGLAMEQYRNDRSALRACGEMMRENQPEAVSVRSKADTLPGEYFNLKEASFEVFACVSCSDDAIEDCGRVAESLAKAK